MELSCKSKRLNRVKRCIVKVRFARRYVSHGEIDRNGEILGKIESSVFLFPKRKSDKLRFCQILCLSL
jgi:hypothetical protein